ncbi:hypothetical protein X762_21550 [Mesorhizobium sp. LSHC426A00]|nr:hypothetical protein X762_21550 [Mesorhizobium sp. LSHC426A00]ESX54457.1 hypothetical protein X761_16690 [Mesorhizobium sp. LSHC424B00]ESX72374.1 hypothetical protein X758_14730 [Mesorhizobium sp. LSHC416B00]
MFFMVGSAGLETNTFAIARVILVKMAMVVLPLQEQEKMKPATQGGKVGIKLWRPLRR